MGVVSAPVGRTSGDRVVQRSSWSPVTVSMDRHCIKASSVPPVGMTMWESPLNSLAHHPRMSEVTRHEYGLASVGADGECGSNDDNEIPSRALYKPNLRWIILDP